MESATTEPLLVICGPTASGKSDTAMQIASSHNGEIICADSRTIYKGMDIGTAKPSKLDQEKVPHHLLDIVEPSDRYTAHDFQVDARKAIQDIRSRNKLPIMVGGTGLYVDAVLYDYSFGDDVDVSLRNKLEAMTLDQLYKYCLDNNISLPENYKNKRYVVRNIERKHTTVKSSKELSLHTIVVGITTENNELKKRIVQRTEYIFEHGVVEEATTLGKKYGWERESMTGNVYPLVKQYLAGELTYDELKQKNTTQDWRLAKRQKTWLKRNKDITWVTYSQAVSYINDRLAEFEQK